MALGVLGGLAVFVSLALVVFGLLDAVPVTEMDGRYASAVVRMWWALAALAVAYELAPWVLEVVA